MAKAKLQEIKVKDYGDAWINRLVVVGAALEKMAPDERAAALRFFKFKYSAEWPLDNY